MRVLDTDHSAAGTAAITSDLYFFCQGRLSAAGSYGVPSSDVTGLTTLYLSPYSGTLIGLYSGSAWGVYSHSSPSLALSGLTSGKNYDVYAYLNTSTLFPTLELGPAWNTDTARFASGTYATALPVLNGIYVKSTDGTATDNTRRYLGTIRTTGTTTTEDSKAKRFIWNYYNRKPRSIYCREYLGGTAYNGGWRQFNANSANKVEIVVGVVEEPVNVIVCGELNGGTGAGFVAWYPDATNNGMTPAVEVNGANTLQMTASGIYVPTAGYHYLALTQFGNSATTTFVAGELDGWVVG